MRSNPIAKIVPSEPRKVNMQDWTELLVNDTALGIPVVSQGLDLNAWRSQMSRRFPQLKKGFDVELWESAILEINLELLDAGLIPYKNVTMSDLKYRATVEFFLRKQEDEMARNLSMYGRHVKNLQYSDADEIASLLLAEGLASQFYEKESNQSSNRGRESLRGVLEGRCSKCKKNVEFMNILISINGFPKVYLEGWAFDQKHLSSQSTAFGEGWSVSWLETKGGCGHFPVEELQGCVELLDCDYIGL